MEMIYSHWRGNYKIVIEIEGKKYTVNAAELCSSVENCAGL